MWRSLRQVWWLPLLLTSGGCAHERPRAARRVAIVPVDTMGVDPRDGQRLQAELYRQARQREAVKPTSPSKVASALEKEDPRCLSDRCLTRVGKAAQANLVLSATLAGLGDTRLVRARLVRVRDAFLLQDLQETISTRKEALERSAADLIRRLFPETVTTPWYRRWWFWSTVAVVVSASVGVTVWLAVDSSRTTDRDPSLVHVGDL